MTERPVIAVMSGSPHARGNSERMAASVLDALAAEGFETSPIALSGVDVRGCVGCGACYATGECVLSDEEGSGGSDGFDELYAALDAADALVLVAPVYFAGPAARLKAFIDRLQFLWVRRYLLGEHPVLPHDLRRGLCLVVVGSGGDPFGYAPLETCVASGMHMMDYELREVVDCVGYGSGDAPAERAAETLAAQAALRLARDTAAFGRRTQRP